MIYMKMNARRRSRKKVVPTEKQINTLKNKHQRNKLNMYEGKTIQVLADFICFSKTTVSRGIPSETVLLQNLRLKANGRFIDLCDHIWVNVDNINNIKDIKGSLSNGVTLNISATPYPYYQERYAKIRGVKYGIKDVNVLSIANVA